MKLQSSNIIPMAVLLALPSLCAGQITNLALNGTARQSTDYSSAGLAGNAIDGIIDGTWANGSVSHTLNIPGSWWDVRLPSADLIDEIRIHNRADCCGNRLSNFRLSVFHSGWETWGNDFFPLTQSSFVPQGGCLSVVLPPGTMGDRVRIKYVDSGVNLNGNHYLSLAEVEVLQYGPTPLVNIAPLGTASQSSTSNSAPAGFANDGNLDGYFANGSVSHTANAASSWWEVALASRQAIDRIRVANRADCCGDRLSNFRLSIFDGTSETFGQVFFAGTGSVPIGGILSVDIPAGTLGDRVRIQLQGQNNAGNGYLSLAEVEVLSFHPGLVVDRRSVSQTGNREQALSLSAGLQFGNRQYLLLGSVSGTAPGLPLGSAFLPLNPDSYFLFTLNNPGSPPLGNSVGVFDPRGLAGASFTVPTGIPGLVGLALHHAYLVFDPSFNIVDASNAAPVEIEG